MDKCCYICQICSFSRWRVSMEHTWQMSTSKIHSVVPRNSGLWLHLTREESGTQWRLQMLIIMGNRHTVIRWVMLCTFTMQITFLKKYFASITQRAFHWGTNRCSYCIAVLAKIKHVNIIALYLASPSPLLLTFYGVLLVLWGPWMVEGGRQTYDWAPTRTSCQEMFFYEYTDSGIFLS